MIPTVNSFCTDTILILRLTWFTIGAISSSIIWGLAFFIHRKRLIRGIIDIYMSKDMVDDHDSVENSKRILKILFKYWKSRRSRRNTAAHQSPTRWPWDRTRPGKNNQQYLRQKYSLTLDGLDLNTSKKNGVDIGSIFGLDVGGTLAKLVYFKLGSRRMYRNVYGNQLNRESFEQFKFPFESSARSLPKMKRSRSFTTSESRHTAEALQSFYKLTNFLDAYGESGVKDSNLSFHSNTLDGEFHFLRFETRMMSTATELIKASNLHANIAEMGATGGGAHKFAEMWEADLGIRMKKTDELESLVAGMQFVLDQGVIGETYTFRPETQNDDSNLNKSTKKPIIHGDEIWSHKVQISESSPFPYIVVIIGTGVSVLRVDGPKKFERVSGSTIGGGTYWGLCRLLTQEEEYDDVLNLAEKGDSTKVDMMVGDIYGEKSDALEKLGLRAGIVASSFGKLVAKQDPAAGLEEADIALALLIMVTNNIGQVGYLNAKLYNASSIYFVGNFLRQNNMSQRRLSYAIDYWSSGRMKALFLEHEGYFGALGAFLLSQNITTTSKSKTNHVQDDDIEDFRPNLRRYQTSLGTSEKMYGKRLFFHRLHQSESQIDDITIDRSSDASKMDG